MSNRVEPSKQQRAFYRKLYLAHLLASGEFSVPALERETGMPRRTIQDCLKTLTDIGIDVTFKASPGGRHNEGCYRVESWGPIRPEWVAARLASIKAVL